MADYNLFMYEWACVQCGTRTDHAQIGITSLGDLLVFWRCRTCQKMVATKISIAKLIADIPPTPEAQAQQEREGDHEFLHNLGIKDDLTTGE